MSSNSDTGVPTDVPNGLLDSKSAPQSSANKGIVFWLIMAAVLTSFFMVVLEGAVVSTALPTISSDLHISQFVWIGTGYSLASMAFLPLGGGLAQIYGRRPVMLASLLIFAVGGALGGAAIGTSMLFAARTIQGLGAGAVLALSSIIISDLVALHERGLYQGLLGLAWSAASGIGPVVGGSLAQEGQWRWLFYMNIPIAAVAGFLVLLYLRLPTPAGSPREKWERIDWIGNCIVVGSSTACVLGLTWGGIQFSWTSPQVLAPLCIGFVGIVVFLVYEELWCNNPVVPFHLLSNRTSFSGYLQTAILSIPFVGLLYYLPVYYQACKGASPIASGVDVFGITFTVAPMTIIAGLTITMTKRYRPQHWMGWSLVIIGHGLMSTLHADSSRGRAIGFQIITGIGIGLVYSSTYFPVLAPLPVQSNALALALYVFIRSFSQIWGVVIGSTVLQNELKHRLPPDFSALFPEGVEIAYAAIPRISTLPQPLQREVSVAFSDSLAVLWRVHLILGVCGLFASLLMRGLPLHTHTDEDWNTPRATDARRGEGD